MATLFSSSPGLLLIALLSLTPSTTKQLGSVEPTDESQQLPPSPPPEGLIDWVKVENNLEVSRSEVTVKAYRACVDAGACDPPDAGGYCNWGRSDRDKHPINCVDWFQARQFAHWLGARLPTQAEWLSLAGPDAFPWGRNIASCDYAAMTERAERCAGPGTSPVCSHPMGHSQKGLCDLAGNVWEWTDEGSEPPPTTAPDVLRQQLVMGGAYYSMVDELGRSGVMRRLPEDRGTGGIGLRILRATTHSR
ncbi:MAG: formylglycine-generating enzyme family protein [Myxococcota bacterium]|nr:formylglycine-generating enzyme family protein [Myxococcota bacterium]